MKLALLALTLLLLSAVFAAALPTAPDGVSVVNSTRRGNNSLTGASIPAISGNISQLELNDTGKITTHWQGYYGQISGKITLDDADQNTLFDWEFVSIAGEVYAANHSTVSWSNATCVNFTSTNTTALNQSIIEDFFNIGASERDGVNETFNYTYAGSDFDVGDVTISAASNCPLAYLYQSNESQQTSFQEVLLTDNISIVYTAIIEQDVTGYNGQAWDFQLLVNEDGSDGNPTDYYFFVELS